jgi:hypothetical protein
MKEEQDKLEKRLWEEREVIRRSHEEKVKVAKAKYVILSYIFFCSFLLTVPQGKDDWS